MRGCSAEPKTSSQISNRVPEKIKTKMRLLSPIQRFERKRFKDAPLTLETLTNNSLGHWKTPKNKCASFTQIKKCKNNKMIKQNQKK